MKKKLLAILALVCLMTGCAKNVVTPPVPGSTGTPDAIAFRVAADAQAALHSIKIWEQCAALPPIPASVDVDGITEACDPTLQPFPTKLIPLLNVAISSYNRLEELGHAFHDGTNTDQAGLQTAETTLQNDVSAVLAGGK